MNDRQMYAQILGIGEPWFVADVTLDVAGEQVEIVLEHRKDRPLTCPECACDCPGYDHVPRRWRHLDTCQFQTILHAAVPRCQCPEHGVKQVRVAWADEKSRFTALFEKLAIAWMLEVGRKGVARRLKLSWDEADGIMRRAVRRGMARRQRENVPMLGVDEKSFQGRKYVTVVCDLDLGHVLYVGDDRSKESLDQYYQGLSDEQKNAIEGIAMDMWDPYVASTKEHVPDGQAKIVYDKFHVVKHLNEAVDKVRRGEHKELLAQGDERLKRSKYAWLRNTQTERRDQKADMASLRKSKLRTARGWAMKETILHLWDYRYLKPARDFFTWWKNWADRSKLEPIQKVARMMTERLANILTYVKCPITNAMAESLNAKIQWIKYTARGFKSRDGFRNAIYFHCGGLNLYPLQSP